MFVFGYNTIGTTQANGGEFVLASKETLGSNASITKLVSYVDGNPSGCESIRSVIYTDSASAPNTLVASGTATTILVGMSGSWFDLVFSAPVPLTAGVYWIGFHFGGGAVAFNRYSNTLSNNLAYRNWAFALGPPDPFIQDGFTNERMSIYADAPSSTDVLSMQTHVFGHGVW